MNQARTSISASKMDKPSVSIKEHIKPLFRAVDRLAMSIAAKNQLTSGLYCLLRGGFGRELQSVLSGKLAYNASLDDPKINTSLLRRNIHRLEKGMLMRPRRVPFGLDYIDETVQAYVKAVEANTDEEELAWARDVLQEYMSITPSTPRVDPLRKLVTEYASLGRSRGDFLDSRIPYIRDIATAPNISYEDLLNLAKYRRSIRWYLPKKVPRNMIERAIEIAAYSPSACNRLPYEFRIFDEPALIQKIIELPKGTSGFNHQVPTLAVVVGKLRNYQGQYDRHCIYTDTSLAIMSFVYALEVQGLSSCCINWPDHEEREKKMASLLGLAPDERPIMLVSFGWPDPEGLVACSTKKSIKTLCKYNLIEE